MTPTHGNQQMSMFNGYYGQFMLNELFFHDGQTGQIILLVLRSGNSHSNKWYVSILKRIIIKIKSAYPKMEIVIRTDSSFSCVPFYELVGTYNLLFVTGQVSNAILKKKVSRAEKAVKHLFLNQGQKHQHFINFSYKAKSWHREQQCYSKVESTGLGMNIRHFVSNTLCFELKTC